MNTRDLEMTCLHEIGHAVTLVDENPVLVMEALVSMVVSYFSFGVNHEAVSDR